jgi:hypothetical protein
MKCAIGIKVDVNIGHLNEINKLEVGWSMSTVWSSGRSISASSPGISRSTEASVGSSIT